MATKQNKQLPAKHAVKASSIARLLRHPLLAVFIGALLTVVVQFAVRDWRSEQLKNEIDERELYKLNSMLLESVAPNVTFQMKETSWAKYRINVQFNITNAGDRAVYVSPNIYIHIFAKAKQTVPPSSDWAVDTCDGGYISPRETIACEVTLKTEKSFDNVGWISYEYNLTSSASDLDRKAIERILGDDYTSIEIAKRLTKTSRMKGEIGRP